MQNSLARLKNAGLLLIAIFSSAIFVGCDYFRIPSEVRKSLKAAGDNKEQLLAVIEHFRHDSEKLEAAYYLISNMPGHYSIEGNSVFEPAFDKIKPILKEEGKTRENGAIFTKLIDSIRQVNPPSLSLREDIKTISSDFLIQNIDLAFEAYHSIPAHLRCDWDTFLKFVLPYRSLQEPIESGLREYFFNNYNWVFERMEKSGSLQNVICELLDSLNFKWDVLYNIPHQMPLSNVYEIGIANTCDLLVTIYAFIFRSLGIPAAYDFTPRYHSWIVFIMQDTFYAVETRRVVNTLYRSAPFPKMYRRTFEKNKTNTFPPNSFDVTGQYRNTINIPLNSSNKVNKAQLKIFNPSRGWITVDESIREKGEIIFNDV